VASEQIVRRGVAHVPEGRKIFPGLTVVENLEVAAAWRGLKRRERAREVAEVLESFPRLERRRTSRGWSLSGGEQQMLAIGRALLARPRLLLLDEPSLGLAPNLTMELFGRIQEINRAGTAVVLVEQNAFMALKICERAYVMETGRTVLSGPAASLARDPAVKGKYFG
jgi:branched-chain amino acid transport system ATP-binding protein